MNYYGLYYPMKFAIPADSDYQILDSAGTVVYSGRVAQMPNDTGTPQVDIVPIMRQLVPAPDYGMVLQNVEWRDSGFDENPKPHIFTLKTTQGDTQFAVSWDYSNDTVYSQQPRAGIIGGGIQDFVYREQPFVLSTELGGATVGDNGNIFKAGTTGGWVYDLLKENTDILQVFQSATLKPTREYTVKACMPENTVILYYVDAQGGMSWVICDHKNTTKQNITRSQITHESHHDPDQPTAFGVDNYMITSYDSYTLNTGYLTDEQSLRLQQLFRSPKVWIYGAFNRGIGLRSVVLTDTSQDVKFKDNTGRLFNYTIKCRESQTLEIYG